MAQAQKDNAIAKTLPHNENSVVLNCSADEFKRFIASLLGKPQSIGKVFRGAFDLGLNDIEDLYHLVNQRVCQQNDNRLLQFTCRIVFDDSSSVLLNSFSDLQTHKEIRPVASTQVHLTWSYLVSFPDRKNPEKQEIEVSFITRTPMPLPVLEDEESVIVASPKLLHVGFITFSIKHTARTWGADIEAMLTGHVKNVLQKPSKIRNFVWKNSSKISLAVFLMFFATAVVVSFLTASTLWKTQQVEVAKFIADQAPIENKLDFIMNTLSSGIWSRYFYAVIVFLIFALITGLMLSIWVGKSAGTNKPSFLTLTREAEKQKTQILQKYEKKWTSFIVSLITSVCTGVVGNILFALFWKGK